MLCCSPLRVESAENLQPIGNPFWLRKMSLSGISRNQYSVRNIHRAFDGNDESHANAAFWGAGQGIRVDLPQATRIGKARLVAHVYDGPEWGSCAMSFGGVTLTATFGSKQEKVWTGDTMVSVVDVPEYARTKIYAIELWEKVFFNA